MTEKNINTISDELRDKLQRAAAKQDQFDKKIVEQRLASARQAKKANQS